MAIKLEVIKENNKEIQVIDITQLIGSVTWSGDIQEASRSLEFDMIVSPYDKNIPKVDVKCGDVVKFYENNKEEDMYYLEDVHIIQLKCHLNV